MRAAVEARSELRDFVWVPYLAGEYVGDPAAARQEAAFLAAGHIQAAAFRCAARRRN